MGMAPVDGRWVVRTESLAEQIKLHQEHAEVIVGVLNDQPNMGKWSQQGRYLFWYEMVVGTSRMLSHWAAIDDVPISRE